MRRRKCKFKYCPDVPLCGKCWARDKARFRDYCIENCKPASERYAVKLAVEKARLEAGDYLRCAADRVGAVGADLVNVIFRNAEGKTFERVMAKKTYNAVSLGVPAGVEDFEAKSGYEARVVPDNAPGTYRVVVNELLMVPFDKKWKARLAAADYRLGNFSGEFFEAAA